MNDAFGKASLSEYLSRNSTLLVPVACTQARGSAGVDYEIGKEQPTPLCWYEMPKLRKLYGEYADVADKELSDKLYAKAGIVTKELQAPWALVWRATGFAVGPPLVVLILALAIWWVVAGFRRDSAKAAN